jgi:hypothetical protein
MDDKITIIEGPPPIFEAVMDGWALGMNDSPVIFDTAITRLRTFNSAALVERCHRTWHNQSAMYLHYRNNLGLEERVPILAARAIENPDGQMLLLWVRRLVREEEDEVEGPEEDSLK